MYTIRVTAIIVSMVTTFHPHIYRQLHKHHKVQKAGQKRYEANHTNGLILHGLDIAGQAETCRSCMYIYKKAGDGNRTHVSSLEGWCSTIELHPQNKYENKL